ncbi:RNA-binding protein with serine-rich domain 1-like [Schistocerca americana]|uniref:RNA-binding protein with serine-rich domain 1-like n=1 Tax=Schistocerca americana TaxID=7009 RepID=UPI001F4FC3BD|nr:RNA-binding protein with serine-rich domain 1-like [Schistocerca americana]
MPQPNLETVVCSRSPGRYNCREHSSTPKPTTLQIGQLSRNVTREHIFEIFNAFGNVKSVEFPMDKLHPGCGTGSAYVEYATLAEAQRAMKHMVGGQIDGQEITAALVLMPPKPRPSLPRPRPPRRPVHCWSRSPPSQLANSTPQQERPTPGIAQIPRPPFPDYEMSANHQPRVIPDEDEGMLLTPPAPLLRCTPYNCLLWSGCVHLYAPVP